HPVTAAFRGRRVTIWYEPRWLEPLPLPDVRVEPLVTSSASGWAETQLDGLVRAPAAPDAHDAPRPVAGAVAAPRDPPGGPDKEAGFAGADRSRPGGRLVVLGSARSFASAVVEKGGGGNDALVASALSWLTGRVQLVGVGPKSP